MFDTVFETNDTFVNDVVWAVTSHKYNWPGDRRLINLRTLCACVCVEGGAINPGGGWDLSQMPTLCGCHSATAYLFQTHIVVPFLVKSYRFGLPEHASHPTAYVVWDGHVFPTAHL